jgi:bifunctional enzyme CysN/CysC
MAGVAQQVATVRDETTTAVTPAAAVERRIGQDLDSSLHVLTCGSVDDGKSTLIGRMLWDTSGVFADQREAIERGARTAAGTPDFSMLVDGLAAEREQGITIDIAWRYFELPARRLVIIDSPGHVQYTRNMATGASHADVALLLVDARSGVKEQTRRHLAILQLVGVQRVILAVNKMDLAGWSRERFLAIEADFRVLATRLGFLEASSIPVSAILGDNVARRSEHMPWYEGAPLLEVLRAVPARGGQSGQPFRFPIQLVVRDGADFRGLAGTVASGRIQRGDWVFDALSGRQSRIARIVTMDRDLESLEAGQAATLQLETDLDLSRGALLSTPGDAPTASRSLEGRVVWLSDTAFDSDRGYLLRTGTDLVPVTGLEVRSLVDLETFGKRPAPHLRPNDIAHVAIELARAVALDRFTSLPHTGCFLLIDAATGATVAGGVIEALREAASDALATFKLTRDLLRRGLCADLGDSPADHREMQRRAEEVSLILAAAGVKVDAREVVGEN